MKTLSLAVLLLVGTLGSPWGPAPGTLAQPAPEGEEVRAAFARQGLKLSPAELRQILPGLRTALEDARRHGVRSSKVRFAAVDIARDLGLDLGPASHAVTQVGAALADLAAGHPRPAGLGWDAYFDETVNLTRDRGFLDLLRGRGFHPVKISWEDIGRFEQSAWGDRISDVGIWVRRRETDPASAQLALSVRRDSNLRDRVLLVPSERIKVHVRRWGRVVERSLPERLRELGLESRTRDRQVIVSNQFAIVPVPAPGGASPEGRPPRAAFTFSIFPYGSSNYVITDVIEGSHEAVVGPGGHQLLFADRDGARAPFTASRAADRPDLQALEADLKAQGMDVDVQRYYLIQVPLRRDAPGLRTSGMGEPPLARPVPCAVPQSLGGGALKKAEAAATVALECAAPRAGLDRVAIGTGEAEGPYFAGAGFRGQRAEEPIRVTVVYFVTPVGRVTARDMETFAQAFAKWDAQAIWGGSLSQGGQP